MSLSELISFSLKLKGKGLFLSPKEINFLKELSEQFSDEEIKLLLEKCYKKLIPPSEKSKSPLTRCRKLFNKTTKNTPAVYNKKEHWQPTPLEEILQNFSPEEKEKIKKELKEFFGNRKPTKDEIKAVLKLILRKYI